MLQIENAIVPKLEKLQVPFVDEGGAAKDDVGQFARTVGMSYPLIKVSKTILHSSDISTFILKTGLDCKLPTVQIVFRDDNSQFRDSDFLSGDTPVRVWIGSTMSDERPLNMKIRVTDVKTANGMIALSGVLDIPTTSVTVYAGSVQDMLQGFADRTGLGVICNDEAMLSKELDRNFVDMTPFNFAMTLCQTLGVSDWFIDGRYNLQILDIATALENHVDKECRQLFESNEQLEEPQIVRYDNNNDTSTQFKFAKAGFNFVQNAKPAAEHEPVTFDKSYEPDVNKYQVVEGDYVPEPKTDKGRDTLNFTGRVDPYKLPGETMKIAVFTDPSSNKRIDKESYDNGERMPIGQQLIADETGTYLLSNATFTFANGEFAVHTDFERVKIEEEHNEANIAKIGATPFKAKWTITETAPVQREAPAPVHREAPAQTAPPKPASGTLKERIVTCMNFLMGKGFSKAQAAGIVGNLIYESGGQLNPNQEVPDTGGLSCGIAQWHLTRRTKLKSLPNWNTLPVQLNYLWTELNSVEARAHRQVRSANDLYGATYAFLYHFERPKDRAWGGPNHTRRYALAQRAFASV